MFNIGDKVVCLTDYKVGNNYQFKVGSIYIVSYVDGGRIGVYADERGTPNGWEMRHFKVVQDELALPDWF